MFEGYDALIQETRDHSGSFMYWSVPYYWLREIRLQKKSTNWLKVEGLVNSSHRTKGGYKQTIRSEVLYSYVFNGKQYSGRVVRDCCFAISSANHLIDQHNAGEKIQVLVNPEKPEESYYPSGFGSIEPFLTLLLSSFGTLLLVGIVSVTLLSRLTRK